MVRMILGCMLAITVMVASGCAGAGGFSWVTDSDAYWKLSGLSVQAPSGPNWIRMPKDEKFPNSIVFANIEQTPIRFNPYHPEFTVTVAKAYGASVATRVAGREDRQVVEDALRQFLSQLEKQHGIVVQHAAYDTSLGASCLAYRGKPLKPEVDSGYGTVRFQSVSGFLCLHPKYDDFLVVLESRDGASVELVPKNRDYQTDHFFKSILFTPRDLPLKPVGPPSKDEKKRVVG
jgi:hypothetical protein